MHWPSKSFDQCNIRILLYGLSKFSILIGWQAVRKTHIRTVVRIFRIWTGFPDVVYLAGNFCFANRKKFCFLIFQLFVIKIYRQIKISNNQIVFDWACMPTVYCYPVKLTIADLIRAKSLCSQTQFSHSYNKPIIDLACSVCTMKYQTSVFCMDLAPSSLGPY
jgi:hypothetical protein